MPDGMGVLQRGPADLDSLAAFGWSDETDPAPVETTPLVARNGRGATLNPASRFDSLTPEACTDGWPGPGCVQDLPPLPTILVRDGSRSAISWNESPDVGFDRAVNPYRGCEHGCIYCYARPSHAQLGYSPGLDFETRIVFKPEIASLLEKELRRPGYEPSTLALGSNTDPYQPVERTMKLTRSVLEVLERFGHPVSIVTKSAGVTRDLDILGRMAARGLVRVWLSVTTMDASLARTMEPRASSPARRLSAIAELNRAGVPAGVLAAPMIPGLNDAEMEGILEAAGAAGASYAGYVLLRLPHELRDMFGAWLTRHVPDRARHVLSLIRQTRGGALNDSSWHDRFVGAGPYADLLARRFERASRQIGFGTRHVPLDHTQFRVPGRAEQLSLI